MPFLLNAGGYTAYLRSAISDAIAGVTTPTLEDYISNIYKREEFRHKSIISQNPVLVWFLLRLKKAMQLGIQYFSLKLRPIDHFCTLAI